jgi:hypothetical protein
MIKSVGHLPESSLFQPLDWSYANGFLLDPKFEKKSEILEVNKNGTLLTSAPILKDNGSERILGEFNSIILGYKNTVPIAEIGMAKASECAYTSFEMPIVNHEDENGWSIHDSNPGQTTSIVNEGFCGGKAAKVDFSFGPTINIPFDMANPKDYVFEAWVKKANPSSPEASICNLGGYICTATDPNGAPWGARGASSPNFTLTEQWQKIRLEVPSSGYGGLTGQNFVLRFYSISNRANGASAGQGFLIDDCRIYPKEAVMKNQTVDLGTGNSYNIDAKGRMIQNVNEKGMAVKKGIEGNLLEINVLNFSK